MVLNSKKGAKGIAEELGVERVVVVDATEIALRYMKTPIVNVAMLGALARALEGVSLDSLARAALKIRFNITFKGDLSSMLKSPAVGEAAMGIISALVEAHKLAEVYGA